jgi:hypothetical protein
MIEPSEDHNVIEHFIKTMQTIAVRLRTLGLIILMLTLFNIGIISASAIGFMSRIFVLQISALIFVILVIQAVLFDQLRRRGEVIYGEITDAIHRSRDEPRLERPQIWFRIALKNFALSMDMPLIPGRYGLSLYLLVNLGALVFAFSLNQRLF